MTEPPAPPMGAPSLDLLTGVVFELASQLHVERARRLALEAALEASGALAPGAVERAGGDPTQRARAAQALERAVAGLMRVLTEDADPRTPLRDAAPPPPAPTER